MVPGPPALHDATRKFQKNIVQVWKITNFDRHAALFNGASKEASTSGFSGVRQLNSLARTMW
jgi:hypothetical protein